MKKKTIFISSITSDIGIALAKSYSRDGFRVIGTYRTKKLLNELKGLSDIHLFYCDLADMRSIEKSIKQFIDLGFKWETFISCASYAPPLTAFFKTDFDKWSYSVHVNAIEQLRVLRYIYDLRDKKVKPNAIFFAGPGTNSGVKNFSALTVSKIMLIKMCELLAAENEDLNIFIVGPGWTKTKAHEAIISDPEVSKEKYNETVDFLRNRQGTSMDDIYDCIRWLSGKGPKVSSGRNVSVVHDCWGSDDLANQLRTDKDMYKLRRYKNEWKERQGKYK